MKIVIDAKEVVILEKFFKDLSIINQRKVLISAFRKASKPLVRVAKLNAPKDTGQLMKSIGTMAVPNEVAILVGAKKSKGWYGHFTEEGTMQRRRRSGGRTGKIRATKWFETAFDMTSKSLYSTIDEEFYQSINKMIIRTNKKLKL